MKAKPHIGLFALGGTISMRESAPGEGGRPELGGEALAQSAGLGGSVRLSVRDVKAAASANLTLADLDALARDIRAGREAGMDGFVIVQGTDTLEETAFALDLGLGVAAPVAMTGALRRADAPGADGPANLAAAIAAAATPVLADAGVVVVMNDEVHAARFVRKADTGRPDAFSSAPFGPIARIVEGRVRLGLLPARPLPRLSLAVSAAVVPIAHLAMAASPAEIAALAEAAAQGLIVAALGGGHAPEALVETLASIAERMPVVLASRVGAGGMLERTYGYPGGEMDLLGRGLIGAGFLTAEKARLALQLLLGAGADRGAVEAGFLAVREALA